MISDSNTKPVKTAILLLNMGGPESASEVHPYLNELFQDKELLKLPLQKILGNFIAWRRTPFIQQRYEELGQYSPTRRIMEEQGQKIAALLDESSPETAPHVCVPGFRYAVPRTGDELERFHDAERIILFSHYPQHSCSTSGSSLCDAYRWLNENPGLQNKISVIDRWWDREDYTDLWVKLIERKFKEFKSSHNLRDEDVLILYSAHSLPEAYCLEKGDLYNLEIKGTVQNIENKLKSRGLNHKHSLGWQSKVGPKRTKWLSPSTPEVIENSSEKAILIVPVAFTTDHIETLDEIDIEFREYVEDGKKLFSRADCFNLDDSFIRLCGKLVEEHIAENFNSSIRPCCKNCVGKDCAAMREFFGSKPVRYQE
ncbi:MAG: ferrochelatase [Opitutae bacterium]|nr:ferrochelatase [Opitutae bacterium]